MTINLVHLQTCTIYPLANLKMAATTFLALCIVFSLSCIPSLTFLWAYFSKHLNFKTNRYNKFVWNFFMPNISTILTEFSLRSLMIEERRRNIFGWAHSHCIVASDFKRASLGDRSRSRYTALIGFLRQVYPRHKSIVAPKWKR